MTPFDINSSIPLEQSTFREEMLQQSRLRGDAEDVVKLMELGIDRIEKNLPSLSSPLEKINALQLYGAYRYSQQSAANAELRKSELNEVIAQMRQNSLQQTQIIN